MPKRIEEEVEMIPPEEKKVEKSSSNEPAGEITIEKYFQLYDPVIDKYQRVYAEAHFHGIMKSKGSWEDTIQRLMEGEK